MKSVLMSIRPHWCDLIFRGEKTVEVRKSKPKLEYPVKFKVFVYDTTSKLEEPWMDEDGHMIWRGSGRIVG